jgi:hypothetical protein
MLCDSFTLIQTAERKKGRKEESRVIHHSAGTVSHELDRYLIEKVENETEDFSRLKGDIHLNRIEADAGRAS